MTQADINEAEWHNPQNWSAGPLGVYSSARDSRVWVPKRIPALGWTLNFARSESKWWLAGLLAAPLIVAGIVGVVIRK